jgi:large subunit ribosomal protein L10
MSKYVKNLISDHLHERLQGVNDALLVNMVGLNAGASHKLRSELRSKGVNVVVVKNSLAARAVAGTPLAGLMDGVTGSAALCWGGEDIVSLAKAITRLIETDQYTTFRPRGGVMDGERLSPEQVIEVSKWPSRAEQLSMLLGQILSPGANLVSQLTSVGGALASQIEQRGKGENEGQPGSEAAPESPETPASPEAPAAATGAANSEINEIAGG